MALWALVLSACAGEDAKLAARPDVIFVVIDTLRADRLPFYGHEVDTAPFLNGLAQESLVFENVWSTSSWTAPATASLFTSLHPFQHGVETGLVHYEHHRDDGATARQLPQSVETLPEMMRRLGYRTFGITDNVNVGERLGFDRGFDRFEQSDYAGADGVNQTLAAWADEIRNSDKPTFVYLHYMDPHEPYHLREETWERPRTPALGLDATLVPNADDPPKFYGDQMVEWIEGGSSEAPLAARARQAQRAMLSIYDSEIGWVDRHVREAFELLGEHRDSLAVLVSDHGEEFGDHGRVAHDFRLYNELVRVPLLLRLPGAQRHGRVADPCSLIDLFPTLRAFLGEAPSAVHTGRDLLASPIESRSLFAARVRFTERGREEIRAAQRGRYKAILSAGGAELFDLERDPGESENRAQEQSAEFEELDAAWKALTERSICVEQSLAAPLELDGATIEHLRELGYADGGRD